MLEIKKGWKLVKLNDICTKITDGSHSSPKSIDSGGYPMASVKDMLDYGINLSSCRRISESDYILLERQDCKPLLNDILIAKDGSYLKHVFVTKEEIDLIILSSIAILRPNLDYIFPDYFKYILLNPYVKEGLKGYVSGVAIPRIILKDFKKFEILIPENIQLQQKISSILSKYDDLIENNNKRIKILEETAQSIYEEWFVKYNFPGSENIKMIDSGNDDFGMIPEGWELKTVGESFTTVLGGTPSRIKEEFWGGNIPWINSGKVNDLMIINESEFITELGYSKSSTKLMPKGTTVIAITGATLGQVSILGIEACANQSVIGIYDETGFYSNYIYYFFMNNINRIISHAGGGAQQHINKDIVNQIKVIIPKNEILEDFNINVLVIIDEMKNLFFKNRNLKETRDLLIPRLVSGELDVESLDVK